MTLLFCEMHYYSRSLVRNLNIRLRTIKIRRRNFSECYPVLEDGFRGSMWKSSKISQNFLKFSCLSEYFILCLGIYLVVGGDRSAFRNFWVNLTPILIEKLDFKSKQEQNFINSCISAPCTLKIFEDSMAIECRNTVSVCFPCGRLPRDRRQPLVGANFRKFIKISILKYKNYQNVNKILMSTLPRH